MERISTGESGLVSSVVLTVSPNESFHPNKRVLRRRGKKTDEKTYLNFFYTNATSLVNKWDEFISLINASEFPHILMITETWFNSRSIKIIPNYTLFNKDREQVVGGGVAIYVRNDLEAFEVCEVDLAGVISEQIWCSVTVGADSLLLGCIYRPPYSSHETSEEIFKAMVLAKKLVDEKMYTSLLIAGDLNFPKIKWTCMHGYVEGYSNAGIISSKFIETLEDNFLVQHVQGSTFGDKILDLVLTDSPDRIYTVNVGAPLGTTAKNKLHSTLQWDFVLKSKPKAKLVSKILYNKGNYKSLNEYLWSRVTEIEGLCVDSMFNRLVSIYQEGVSKFIPKLVLFEENITTRSNPKWFNRNIKKLTNLKYEWFIKTRINSKNLAIRSVYNSICRQVKKEVKNARLVYELSIINGCKNNPKRIFSYNIVQEQAFYILF